MNYIQCQWIDNTYKIKDISTKAFQLFYDFTEKKQAIDTDLTFNPLVQHLNILRTSIVQYLEFSLSIQDQNYNVKLIKINQNTFTIYFNFLNEIDSSYELLNTEEDQSISFFDGGEEIFTNDLALKYVYGIKTKSSKDINLEGLYYIRTLKEEIDKIKKEIKMLNKNTLQKQIRNIGIPWLIIFLLMFNFLNKLFISPLTNQLVEIIHQSIEKSSE